MLVTDLEGLGGLFSVHDGDDFATNFIALGSNQTHHQSRPLDSPLDPDGIRVRISKLQIDIRKGDGRISARSESTGYLIRSKLYLCPVCRLAQGEAVAWERLTGERP